MVNETFQLANGELEFRDGELRIQESSWTFFRSVVRESLIAKVILTGFVLFVAASLIADRGFFSRDNILTTLGFMGACVLIMYGLSRATRLFGQASTAATIDLDAISRVAVKERDGITGDHLVIEFESDDGEREYRPVILQPHWYDDSSNTESILGAFENNGATIEEEPDWTTNTE